MGKFWQRFRKEYRGGLFYGLLALMIFVPLYPKFPLVQVAGSYVPVRLEDLLVGGLLLVWFLGNWGRWREVGGDRLNQAIFWFVLAGLVSLVSAIWVTKTVVFHIGWLHWIRRVEYMGLFLVARDAIWERRQLSVYVQVLMLVVLGATFFGLGQIFWEFPVISTQNVEFSKGIALRLAPGARLSSTFAGHYDLSAFCVLVMPVVVGFVAMAKRWRERLVFLGIFGAALWLLLASASRISYPAALVGMWVSLGFLRKFKWLVGVSLVAVLALGVSGDLAGRYEQVVKYETGKVIEKVRRKLQVSVPVVWAAEEGVGSEGEALSVEGVEGIEGIPSPEPVPVKEDRSSSIRMNVEWPRAVRAFKKNPLLGTGVSSITLATDNDYLRLLGEMGVLGFLAFILIFLRLFNKLKERVWECYKKPSVDGVFVVGVAGAIVGMLINATFIDVFEASKVAMMFWLICGLGVGSLKMKRK